MRHGAQYNYFTEMHPESQSECASHAPFARPMRRQTALKAQQRRHVRPGVFAAFRRKRAQPPFRKLPAIIEPKLKMGTHIQPKATPDGQEIEIGFRTPSGAIVREEQKLQRVVTRAAH